MPSVRAATFGRRGQPLPPPPVPLAESRAAAAEPFDLGPDLSELARSLRSSQPRTDEGAGAPDVHVVPRSFLAALLAGVATACLAASFTIADLGSRAESTTQINSLAHLSGLDGKLVTPTLLLLSLLSAGRATAGTLLTAHYVLRRFKATSLVAYVLGGAAAGAFWVFADSLLGGSGHDLVKQVAMGACAGFFYRLIAGARRSAASGR